MTVDSKIIQAEHISKTFGLRKAVKDVSISAKSGEIIGLIGPDGAGKSTLMKILLTLEQPDEGTAWVFSENIQENKQYIRQNIGYMPENFSLYLDLSVEENLKFYFRIYKMGKSAFPQKLERLYEFNRLKPFRKNLAKELSGGMKQKLALSCALMHEPRLLILDEPTTGVDPLSRKEFWNMLHELSQQGITILISTPYMDEAFQCNHIYLMHKGDIIESGLPSEIIKKFGGELYEIPLNDPHQVVQTLKDKFPGKTIYMVGKNIRISSSEPMTSPEIDLISKICLKDQPPYRLSPSLEDIFLSRILALEEINGRN